MKIRVISIILILCLLLSTTTAFAATPETLHIITINGENYTIAISENASERIVRTYNSDGLLVEQMQYDKESGILYDILKDIEYEALFLPSLNSRNSTPDSEGYYFIGDYVLDLADVYKLITVVTVFVTYGVPVVTANNFKEELVRQLTLHLEDVLFDQLVYGPDDYIEEYGITIEVRGQLWMKEDSNYDYSKKIDEFYGLAYHFADIRIGGPITLYQRKSNDT